MDQSRKGSVGISFLVRLLLAAMLLIITVSIGRAQEPPGKPVEPVQQKPPAKPVAQPAAAPSFSPQDVSRPGQSTNALALNEAVRLAIAQASSFQQAQLAELIAAEDVRQARLAFLPRAAGSLSPIYNSPARGPHPAGTPHEMSFISADAITRYEALAGVTGELDIGGRLRATLRRNVALLEAARAGTEVARRALVQAVNESYYGLALASARRSSAALSLRAAEEFEQITKLLLEGGEVAEVDLRRARLQTATRRDESEQAIAAESAAADSLRVLVGYDFTTPILTTELAIASPDLTELDRFTSDMISRRPEFVQFEAERRAAEQETKAARSERLPQISYSFNGGFDSDSLSSTQLNMHSGVLAGVSVTIPLFDWGASRSRERQAQLRAQSAESQRALALRGFTQQFNTARAQAVSAAARVRLLQSSLTDADLNVQASIARYRAGEAPILEVTDSQTTLATQRAALYRALFDYQMARARLAQAAGQ
jgi:outer membrane protein TolC